MKSILSPKTYLNNSKINPYRHVALDEAESTREDPRAFYTKRSNKGLCLSVIILALGWAATFAYIYHTRTESNGLLHVYHNTPIPKEVFNPVKKIFHRDERYIGWSDEVNRNWDTLVAGNT